MLTIEEINKIQQQVIMGIEVDNDSEEAQEFVEELRANLEDMESRGVVPDLARRFESDD